MKEKDLVISYKGKQLNLYDINGKIIRRFTARAEIVNATITREKQNPAIAITTKDGKFEVYRANGSVIRRS